MRPRLQVVARATAAMVAARAASALLPLVAIPWSLDYLGTERFGMWMTVIGFTALLALAEGGVSTVLLTATARDASQEKWERLRTLHSSALVAVLPMAITVCAVGFLLSNGVNWSLLLGLNDPLAGSEAPWVVLIVCIGVALSFICNVTSRFRIGLGQTPQIMFWDIAGTLAAVPALFLAIHLDLGTPGLVAAVFIIPIAFKLLAAIVFAATNPQLRPNTNNIERQCVSNLFRLGLAFLTVSFSYAICTASDQFIIANMLGADQVASYAVMLKLYTQPLVIANLLLFALWPQFTAALARGEHAWLQKTFWVALLSVVGLAAAMSTGLLATQTTLLHLWVGGKIQPSALLSWNMALFAMLSIAAQSFHTLFSSIDRWSILVKLSLTMMVANVVMTILLVQSIGIEGAIIATNIAFLLVLIFPGAYFSFGMLRELQKTIPKPAVMPDQTAPHHT